MNCSSCTCLFRNALWDKLPVEKILCHVVVLFPRDNSSKNALDARSIEKEEAFATERKGLIAFP